MPLNFADYDAFIAHLHRQNRPFPLKILGGKSPAFATMLSAIYQDTQDPGLVPLAQAVFGVIQSQGLKVDATVYSKTIRPTPTNENHFQGDIIELPSSQPRRLMLISQTCDIARSPYVTCCPVYLESELDQHCVESLLGRPVKSNDLRSRVQGLLASQNKLMLGLPAPNVGPINEPFVAALHRLHPLSSADVKSLTPAIRLSYRGLALLQWRLAALLLRDVEKSDETRDW